MTTTKWPAPKKWPVKYPHIVFRGGGVCEDIFGLISRFESTLRENGIDEDEIERLMDAIWEGGQKETYEIINRTVKFK